MIEFVWFMLADLVGVAVACVAALLAGFRWGAHREAGAR